MIGILGAGAWGTALAAVAGDNGHDVVLWSRNSDVVTDINTRHRNDRFLPGSELHDTTVATTDITAVSSADIVVLAVPTQHIRSVVTPHRDVLSSSVIVDVAKGIELGTHLRVSQILEDCGVTSRGYSILSGPSHAEEVIKRMPTTVVLASDDMEICEYVQDMFTTDTFRVYGSGDVVGVEICGALKNVIAIAGGIVDGLGLGDNTKAALITRGLAEITRLGVALGARPQTFYGLAGLGDLFVTCTSRHSRNRFVGDEIGKGRTLTEILAGMSAVAEGVPTTNAALELALTVGVELPITQKVHDILFEGEDPNKALRDLMLRPLKAE
jgi:glycerol-3-phosphate dehydrogenase (NAD(P)+)